MNFHKRNFGQRKAIVDIALSTGIGSGAESILIPETDVSVEMLIDKLNKGVRRKKLFSVVIVAEGNKHGGANEVAAVVKERFKYYDTKVTIIGHLQRGGSPTALDRVIASRMGYAAVEGLLAGKRDVMVGIVNDQILYTPFEEAVTKVRPVNEDLLKIAEILAV